MLAPQPDVFWGLGGSLTCLGGCSLEQGVHGELGVPLCITQVGAAPGAAVRVMHSKAGPLLLAGIFFFSFR